MTRLILHVILTLLLLGSPFGSGRLFAQQVRKDSGEGAREAQTTVVRASSALKRSQLRFAQGDIVATRSVLLKSVERMKGPEKEEGLKLLGVCHYLIGDKAAAKDAFQAALRMNPQTKLSPKYLLDPSLSGFFAGIRANSGAPPIARKGSRGAPSVPRPSAASRGVRPGASGVFVDSNAPRSTVFANGLFVGTAGQFIELNPGRYNLAVSAAGFKTANKLITIQRGQQIKINVTLEDPAETRKRQIAAQKAARQKALAARKLQEQRARELAVKAEADRRLQAKRELEARIAAQKAEKDRAKLRAQKQPELYGEALPKGRASLVDEFKSDQSRVTPAKPRRSPHSSSSGHQRSLQSSQQPAAQSSVQSIQQAQNRRTPYASRSLSPPRARRQSSKSTFLAVLPFGSGQFQNGDQWLGAAFALTQLGLVGAGTWQLVQANQFESRYQQEVTADPSLAADEGYRRASERYISDSKTYGQFMLLGFGAVWAISAVEALVSINSTSVAQAAAFPEPIFHASLDRRSSSLDAQPSRWGLQPVAQLESGSIGLQVQFRY